ncbi:MAG: hypothetical protein J07AB43_15830 [Candidatus Nanosalina sp. J07AB43]|nr:MAG: hypothetical protein J07AB43_15830 [Candidatus Nanosalina sp. J07AB43]
MNLEDQNVKKTYETKNGEVARKVVKKVADQLDYRFQEMNSIAVAYNGSREAVVKNGHRIEAYSDEAQQKVEEKLEE